MKIRMKTRMAGPGGSAEPGRVIELPDNEAALLLQGGFAEPVASERETAAIKPPETAVASKARKRKAA